MSHPVLLNNNRMEKKIVLITGATSGIGEACARRFAKGGFDLILTGRNELRLQAVKEAAEADGAQVKVLRYDVRDRKACREAVESLQGRWACVDVLINNAGLALGLEKEAYSSFCRIILSSWYSIAQIAG